MSLLSAGAIAGIVAGCDILTLTSIAAGALGYCLGQEIQKSVANTPRNCTNGSRNRTTTVRCRTQ